MTNSLQSEFEAWHDEFYDKNLTIFPAEREAYAAALTGPIVMEMVRALRVCAEDSFFAQAALKRWEEATR